MRVLRKLRVWLYRQRMAFSNSLSESAVLISAKRADDMTADAMQSIHRQHVDSFIRYVNENVKLKARGNRHTFAAEWPDNYTTEDFQEIVSVLLAAGYTYKICEFEKVDVIVINW